MINTARILLLAAVFIAASVSCGELTDPALAIQAPLTPDEEVKIRKLFEQLGDDDFAARDRAISALVSIGPRVLPLAKMYETNKDPEISAQVRSLPTKILMNYDGYLPTSPKLLAALRKKAKWPAGDAPSGLRKIATENEIKLLFDPEAPFNGEIPQEAAGKDEIPIQSLFQFWAMFSGTAIIPRGDVLLFTSQERANQLAMQRRTFDWSSLGLDRNESERVGNELSAFLPAGANELHSSPEALGVRGSVDSIEHIARLISLLGTKDSSGIFPAPDAEFDKRVANAMKELSAPVTIELSSRSGDNIVTALNSLKKQGHAIEVTHAYTQMIANGAAPVRELEAFGSLSLMLKDIPLSLGMRWLERRSKNITGNQANMQMRFTASDSGQLEIQLSDGGSHAGNFVGGADVTFLYPRGARIGKDSDAAALKLFSEKLESHFALLPSFDKAALTVVRGRVLVRGPAVIVAAVVKLAQQWRDKGEPPPPAQWRVDLDAKLATKIEWNGAGLTAGRVIGILRKLGQINLLIEDAEDGTPAKFNLPAKDAELLPPGNYPIQALIDELAKRAGAVWRVDSGAVVLKPKAK